MDSECPATARTAGRFLNACSLRQTVVKLDMLDFPPRRRPSLGRSRLMIALSAWLLWLGGSGCQTVAPIHVWAPPRIDSAVGKRIAIAPLAGEPRIAEPLHAAMLRQLPTDLGRRVNAIDARQLQNPETIRLVSAESSESSDIALVSLARRNDIDLVLFGEVMSTSSERSAAGTQDQDNIASDSNVLRDLGGGPTGDRPGVREPTAGSAATSRGTDTDGEDASSLPVRTLRISWKLIDIRNDRPLSGQPVVSHGKPGESELDLVNRAAKDAWELLVPHVVKQEAQLAQPRLSARASRIRQGNQAAAEGRWSEAEWIWRGVISREPQSHAAMHNLAVAAVARQDFAQARQFIAAALAAKKSSLYQATAVWIETRQREYHASFNLPDPPEGWAATRR